MSAKNKQILMIAATILALIVIGGVMLIVGRGHTLYFDSKKYEKSGQVYETPYKVEVYVNGEQCAKLYDGERGTAKWIGQDFTMKLAITDVQGGAEREETYSFKLPYDMDGVTVNLPALMAGLPQEDYLEEFVIIAVEEPEEPVEDDLAGIGTDIVDPAPVG